MPIAPPATLLMASALLAWTGISAAAQETGDLAALRKEALNEVNQVRQEHGLTTLETSRVLDEAAQAHAVDMIEENYYAHVSPDGEAPRDRFLEHGGSRWKVVRENIARCSNCPVPPTLERVRSFQQGWMNSPEHRDNILAEGLESFGFGIAGEGGQVFAVQTFSGPGTPRGLQAGEEPTRLDTGELDDRAVEAVNRAREQQGLQPVSPNPALSRAAEKLLPEPGSSDTLASGQHQLFDLLPQEDRRSWAGLQVLAASCGGCGTFATAEDVTGFVDQWLDNPQHRSTLLSGNIDDMGFAMLTNGEGRKVAIAVAGRQR
ncbi:CAP domain-containing protein [Roseibium salinum]|uniref:CAP domain-containing protein n=1 Tax=Roseibium salinum TaxID=1604349 RepID=A0ABT3R989_9HYPH|nr:CAP domain-containing protein [Roseibium sp. DSM 29163]MCX2725674.1 CAP domain-containing protein [Roseibium sp. DSM 29163]